MAHLFRTESCDPKTNAQRNLDGRSHYVDDDTLRFHKSRILATFVMDEGLLFGLIESCAANYENTRRGFRYVLFDVFGTVIDRPKLEEMWSTRKAATAAMWKHVNKIDAVSHTNIAIEQAKRHFAMEMDVLSRRVNSKTEAA